MDCIQNYMVNIKLHSRLLILLYVCTMFACAQIPGSSYGHLGNNGKKFTAVTKMSSKDWDNPQELERVWQASFVRILTGDGKTIKSTIATLDPDSLVGVKKLPTVIYLHGCSGFWSGTIRRLDFLAANGFAVIAPPSFAREKYTQSCDIYSHAGSFYRDTIKIRHNDAGNAIEKAKQLPWVDENNVFLLGLSEGGLTTATFSAKNNKQFVNARVVEGWTCNAGWDEYHGVNAPKTEPVLTLLGLKDPWFQNHYNEGECTGFLNKDNGSKSIVYRKGKLSYVHELLDHEEVKKPVIEFLQKHLR